MTEIEALLSVDAGRVPPGTTAFFLDDGTRAFRRARAGLAASGALAAVGWAVAGGNVNGVMLIILACGIVGLSALPTLREDSNRDPKRQVLVITPAGLIVRDGQGLRRWRFENLTSVIAGMHDSRPYLHLFDSAGKRHKIECAAYRRGLRARDVIAARLSFRGTTPNAG
ncbi:MAG: hypothetical protein ABUS79_06100 [Pseudomonadota bacterium]